MNKTIRLSALALIATLLIAAVPAQAHHSFPAQYDITKPVTLKGTITKVEWTNPHIYIYIDVTDAKTGALVNWALELGGPNTLLRLGWKRDSLKTGDVITIEGSLARDGSNLANPKTIILDATGKTMLTGSSGPA
jgi:hypothetical protein